MKTMYVHPRRDARVTVDLSPDLLNGTGGYIVNRVRVGNLRYRGHGFASEIMREVCRDADREGVILTLVPDPDEDEPHHLAYAELCLWYRRLGFRPPRYGLGWWQRMPHAPMEPPRQ